MNPQKQESLLGRDPNRLLQFFIPTALTVGFSFASMTYQR